MKKTLALIGLCLCAVAVGQPTPTPTVRTNTVRRVKVNAQLAKDSLTLANARIESLDKDFAVSQAQYNLRRNELMRQRDQLQALQTNLVPVTAPSPLAIPSVKPNR